MNTRNYVPFLDLVTPHEELKEELCRVFEGALKTGSFVGGPLVQEFERDFGNFCDSGECIGVGSGTDALRFALIAAGVQPDEIVITVPNTFIATVEAISQAGARPAFVDIDERTYNMDPGKLREYLETNCASDDRGRLIDKETGRLVTAVVPVHLYGQMCDMDPILELAGLYGLTIIEDACQAHGAQYFSRKGNRWRRAGSIGRAAAFSFYPGKNLGACGEAGAVTTSESELASRIRKLRDHGQSQKYHHEVEGYNGRLDAIQAGILEVKLRHLREWTSRRREAAVRYRELLAQGDRAELAPFEPSWTRAVYHLYVIRVENRDLFMRRMADAGIGTAIHYPIPLHLQRAYERLNYKKDSFPVAEKVATEIVSLPMFPQLTLEQQKSVIDAVIEFAEWPAERVAASA